MSQRSSRKRHRHIPQKLEMLEARTLLSAVISPSSYVLSGVAPGSAVYDSSGNLWVLNLNPNDSSLDEISTTAGTQSIVKTIPYDSGVYHPTSLAAGPDGMIYAVDLNGANTSNNFGGIDAINTGTGTITRIFSGTSSADDPLAIAVTGSGAVWFVGGALGIINAGGAGDVIGRIDPTNNSVAETPSAAVPASTDAYSFTLAASGSDSVWVAYDATLISDPSQPSGFDGHNYVVSASFNNNAVQVNGTYAVNSGNSTADQYNYISSIVGGNSGTVWFTLAGGQTSLGAPDLIVQGSLSGTTLGQTAIPVPGATADNPVDVASLTFDSQNNLWFTEGIGSQFGYLDPTGNFTTYNTSDYTDGQPFQMVANPAGTQLSIVTFGSATDAGGPIIQIDEAQATIPFTFTQVSTVSAVQGANISGTQLATFAGPAPASGNYTATITWGDNTTSVVTATPSNGGWAIVAPSKSFSTAGTFNGTITVADGSTTVGSTTFTSNISAIPLNATSLAVTPPLLGIVAAVGTFTNVGNLPLSSITVTINWGDGTTSKGLLVRDPASANTYFVLAAHVYRTKGTFTVQLTATTTDPLAEFASSSITTNVTVTNVL